jgi:DNA-binding MarR family transcriptional regulator
MAEPVKDTAGPQSQHSETAQAAFDLIFAVARTFFRMRAAGTRIGVVTPWGGGLLGLLHGLKVREPHTVPQAARARPVTRQRVQKLADEMAADGLIEFIDNPAHKRSKLMRLTPKGEAVYAEMCEAVLSWADGISRDMSPAELKQATAVLDKFTKALAEKR